MIVLGVDPGGTTGLVMRNGDELLWHATAHGWEDALKCLQAAPLWPEAQRVAIEEVVAPRGFANGQRAPINPGSLIPTAMAAGACAAWAWVGPVGVVWVPPGHNGQGALSAYPEPLRPTRGQGKGSDSLRHCRSAWDVAGTAAMMVKGAR